MLPRLHRVRRPHGAWSLVGRRAFGGGGANASVGVVLLANAVAALLRHRVGDEEPTRPGDLGRELAAASGLRRGVGPTGRSAFGFVLPASSAGDVALQHAHAYPVLPVANNRAVALVKDTVPVHLGVGPTSLVDGPVFENAAAVAVSLIVLPLPLVSHASVHSQSPDSRPQVVLEFALVHVADSVRASRCPHNVLSAASMPLAAHPLAHVLVAIHRRQRPPAVRLVVVKLPLEHVPVSVGELALAFHLPFCPCSAVDRPVELMHCSDSMHFVLFPLAIIHVAVVEHAAALPMPKPSFPFPVVVKIHTKVLSAPIA
mmetsp:Transcript_18277/g.42949  ORF Transcript_18277/g.42949 Transcript_18277/m.42949 type:complete len:315 (+) Transcript_18277:1109-2053(+)